MVSVAVLGSGAAGLITAHTLSTDGFDVQVITRDRSPGGQWAAKRIYPGLQLNNVHGEFRFSAHEMSEPPDSRTTGGRLTGQDMQKYMKEFSDKLLSGKIMFDTEILNIRRDDGDLPWNISVRNHTTGTSTTLCFSKIVLCTGGTSKPRIPEYLSSATAEKAHFQGRVIHSAHFAARLGEILEAGRKSSASIVVVGGGKSAQDICAHLANEGCKVTVIYEKTDGFTAGTRPLPDFVRKSRYLARSLTLIAPEDGVQNAVDYLAPYQFENETRTFFAYDVAWKQGGARKLGWNNLQLSMGISENSPLRLTYSPFWSIHTNDEGIPRKNGFHSLVNKGEINVIAPARMTAYGDDGHSVLLNTGQTVKADMVILATGYISSWDDIFDEKTAGDLGLHRHSPIHDLPDKWKNYKTLANPPPLHPENAKWSSSIYKGMVPAKNLLRQDMAINGAVLATNDGYAFEVAAHWISSYFLGDKMTLPKTPKEALGSVETCRAGRVVAPQTPSRPQPFTQRSLHQQFYILDVWPQHADELLEDMYLPSMRSGGNWFTWPFKVISINELATLHEEREVNRRKNN